MSDETGSTPLGEVVAGVNSHDLQGEELLRNETQPAPAIEATTGDEAAPPAADNQQQQAKGDEPGTEDGGQNRPDGYVPVKAVEAERKKRQELEQRLAFIEGRLAGQPQPQSTQSAPEEDEDVDFYANPEKYVQRQVTSATKGIAERASWDARVATSKIMMRREKPDYDEMEAVFMKAAENNAGLQQQLRNHELPALFAYETGKMLKDLDGVESMDALKQKWKAEMRAEIEAEVKTQNAVSSAANATTSSARVSSGAVQSPAFAGPTALEDIFPGVGV